MPVDALTRDSLPDVLVQRSQWVCWRIEERNEKSTKIPVDPQTGGYASATDSATWTTIDAAIDYARSSTVVDGIGFVFTDDDAFVGIDVDDCRDAETGALSAEARDIVDRLDSYTEISPSGTGLHIIVRGNLPGGRNRRGGIELYETARYFTVTGQRLDGSVSDVVDREEALAAIHREYLSDGKEAETAQSFLTTPDTDVALTDDDLLEKARMAKNGEKFAQLWQGDSSGYDSHSEADMALCCLLAFWTGGDARWIDRLFRESGLMRSKWDDRHYADGATYGDRTIERALTLTDEFYDPDGGGDQGTDLTATGPDGRGEIDKPEIAPDSPQLESTETRQLEARVTNLESTLAQQSEQLSEIERRLDTVYDALVDDAQSGDEREHEAYDFDAAGEDADDQAESSTPSVWERARRAFGTDADEK